MWSIGVIMFELLTGEKPFKTLWGKKISAKKAKKVMSVKKISKERWEMMSEEAQTVIKACCRYESATRPTPNDRSCFIFCSKYHIFPLILHAKKKIVKR